MSLFGREIFQEDTCWREDRRERVDDGGLAGGEDAADDEGRGKGEERGKERSKLVGSLLLALGKLVVTI